MDRLAAPWTVRPAPGLSILSRAPARARVAGAGAAHLHGNHGSLFPWASHRAALAGVATVGLRSLTRRQGAAVFAEAEGEGASGESDSVSSLLAALQGSWEDDVGLSISVKGTDVNFGDGTGPWEVSQKGSSLFLRGTRFIGSADAPAWEFPNGVQRTWSRPEPLSPEQENWRGIFLEYKAERLQLRRQLWASLVVEDSSRAEQLLELWNSGNASSLM